MFRKKERTGVVSVEVLLQWSALDSPVTIGTEGTGKHRDITKGALKWFVENVGHFIFKVLSSDEWVEELLSPL
jgi:hypothetical protein